MSDNQKKIPAAFFDRDGVLNVDKNYLYKIEDFEWMPGAIDSIEHLKEIGYLVVVVTNQSGIAQGFYTEQDVERLHNWIHRKLLQRNTRIDAFYYCPHHPEAALKKYRLDCDCRKPKAGLIRKAIIELNIDIEKSFLIGDKERDIIASNSAGIKGYLFDSVDLFSLVKKALNESSK